MKELKNIYLGMKWVFLVIAILSLIALIMGYTHQALTLVLSIVMFFVIHSEEVDEDKS